MAGANGNGDANISKSKSTLVKVGLSSCGVAAGGREVFDALSTKLKGSGVVVQQTGCIGMCYKEPLVEIRLHEKERYIYGDVTPERVDRIVEEHIKGGKPVDEWLLMSCGGEDAKNPLSGQERIVLRNCGIIDPESIDDYISVGGYKALEKALKTMTPEQVIDEVLESGLRGRGGAGFATGLKWRFTRQAKGSPKYIICNADEGDPGAFMDRSVLESDPHSVLEGMLIAGYAIGASEGYIYVRAEYPMAVRRLRIAISHAREKGFIGESILGSKYNFDIKIREGAGAFVCGEETALIMSIEGKRGMPRSRPPFPAQAGLWGKPTSINNVETFANVAWIITNGAKAYYSLGTEKSKGTKVFALAGKVAHGGLVEVPMGMTIRDIVFNVGGGTSSNLEFKAVQMGGPSGGCVPASLADTPVDYESLTGIGAIMGSGGMLVMDESTCMVDLAKFFLNFTQDESCGKCVPCRIGTKRMLEILNRITGGQGKDGDIELLEGLAASIKRASLCGLGQTAPNPTLTTIKYFRDEYEAHIKEKKCPAKKCQALITYEVMADPCTGCRLCQKFCPTGAITGAKKQAHVIDNDKCIRCGLCMNVCKFDAITVY
ncbi:MAG: NADH-quinone oxidoreductase subunit NuoF [Firmicutes bacterium]|nr:NADH-quinone oxidoreductase subunit NuoF [Bacillota bacterium]